MTQTELLVSDSIVVAARPEVIFDVLADPRRHPHFDGSGMVLGNIGGPDRLTLGARFGMRMRMGFGYRIGNRVVEYEKNRLIAWKHFAPHRWRYELQPTGEAETKVTETFDYSRTPPCVYRWMGWPTRNERAIQRTLPRLKSYVETGRAE